MVTVDDKKISWIYRVLRWFVWLFAPKFKLKGAEKLPDEPCILVGNHSQMNGPIAAELYIPGKKYIWCAGEMMHWKEVHGYAYQDFWSKKPKAVRWFFKLMSYVLTPVSVCIFNNAHTIAVYHDTRLLTTFRESVAKLQEGNSMVIFPECYDEHNNIVHAFQEKFVDLARIYYKKTGTVLKFVPLYVCPARSELHLGETIAFDPAAPIAEERHRLCVYLMDAITELAASLPEHRVVPYPNLPKRLYPKNIPVEVTVNENASTDG